MFRRLLISALVVIATLMMVGEQANAQTPEIGVFFDYDGTEQAIRLDNLNGYIQMRAFVIVRNVPEFHSYEFGVHVTDPYWITGTEILGGSCHYGTNIKQLTCGVGCDEERDSQVVLLTIYFNIDSQISNFKIWAGPSTHEESYDYPVIAKCSNNGVEQLSLSSSPFGPGCAIINPTMTATDSKSWGAIKNLYK